MVHTTSRRAEDLAALDRTIERMRRMVMEHAKAVGQVPTIAIDMAALRATEAVGHLVASGVVPTIKDVALYQGIDQSTASRMVASAQRHGLIHRGHDPADRRRTTLSLTTEGTHLIEEIPRLRVQVLAEALQEWQDAEVSDFRALLERFRVNIDAIGPERLP